MEAKIVNKYNDGGVKVDIDSRLGVNMVNPDHTITIPVDYDHDLLIDSLDVKFKESGFLGHPNLDFKDEIFMDLKRVLISGETYKVLIIPIKEIISNMTDCFDYIKHLGGIMVGIHGLLLLYDLYPNIFPVDFRTISFGWETSSVNYRSEPIAPYLEIYKNKSSFLAFKYLSYSLHRNTDAIMFFRKIKTI